DFRSARKSIPRAMRFCLVSIIACGPISVDQALSRFPVVVQRPVWVVVVAVDFHRLIIQDLEVHEANTAKLGTLTDHFKPNSLDILRCQEHSSETLKPCEECFEKPREAL